MSAKSREVAVEGAGLHTGEAAVVTLRAEPGPVRLRSGGVEAAIADLTVASTRRSTTVEACGGRLRVGTVEHLFAALAGRGVYEGAVIDVQGPELPLLDGGAAAWSDALASLGLGGAAGPPLRVSREAVIAVGASRYELAPGPRVEVEARVELDDARVTPDARWAGDAADFRARIAPARTFARQRDLEDLARGGLARRFDAASVVVLGDAIHHAGRPFSPDEPARHKLLDLIGDLYLYGGPPLGKVRGVRPGHAANAVAFARAVADRVMVPR